MRKVNHFFLILACLFMLIFAYAKIIKTPSVQDSFQLKPYYGFIVTNENGDFFYKIEDKCVQEYIDGNVNDANAIKRLLGKTEYVYDYEGKSIEFYAWQKFFTMEEKANNLFSVDIKTCSKIKPSKLIPVLLVSLDFKETVVSQLDECNPYLNKKLLNPTGLSIVFISPLSTKVADKYHDLRDTITLSSPGYQSFLKSRIH